MATKKKKSSAQRHKQQQKKSQRRSARVQKRPPLSHRMTGGNDFAPMPGTFGDPISSIVQDASPLMRGFGGKGPSEADTERLMEMIWDTAEWADEPEFSEIEIPPIATMAAFATAIQKLNLKPGDLDDLHDPQILEQSAELMDTIVDLLWTDDFSEEIHNALEQLRLRLRRQGRRELPLVAVMQLFMSSDEDGKVAQSFGVVQEIVRRNIEPLFERLPISDLVDEDDFDDKASSPREIYERLRQLPKAKMLEASAQDDEKLLRHLQRQSDKLWEQGEKELFTGRLILGLFSAEEVDHALALYKAAYDELVEAEEDESDEADSPTTIETIASVLPQWQAYLRSILTPARLQQIHTRMDEVVNDSAYGQGTWVPFLMMVRNGFVEESDPGFHERLLNLCLIGEVFHALNMENEEGEA